MTNKENIFVILWFRNINLQRQLLWFFKSIRIHPFIPTSLIL